MSTSALASLGSHCREPRRHGTGTGADARGVCRRRVTRCVRVSAEGEELRHVHVCGGCSHLAKDGLGVVASSIAIPVEECAGGGHG